MTCASAATGMSSIALASAHPSQECRVGGRGGGFDIVTSSDPPRRVRPHTRRSDRQDLASSLPPVTGEALPGVIEPAGAAVLPRLRLADRSPQFLDRLSHKAFLALLVGQRR